MDAPSRRLERPASVLRLHDVRVTESQALALLNARGALSTLIATLREIG
ncbi:hypothetical protein Plo01_65490 [Planobispora longispora]|uniref:Uncharacterized protein n=1 Tax=Planobispora longispora TaxID=28887 RepID=A0A8J3W8Q0_9ACTN|nr:hypothetical protein [Planobispora longispora]BFE80983.1 hypothetical protein GCM10020093_035840 [Planobispora longispora]GIH80120.1 hypothetical protein Plo01_65490 [Planobispora longispora]